MPQPEHLSYVLVFRDGRTMGEDDVRAAGGFAQATRRPDLESFVVTDQGRPWMQIVIRGQMRPVFGRVWVHSLTPGEDGSYADGGRWLRAVCFGWQETVAGRNRKCLVWVTGGGVFLADRDLDEIAES